MRANRLWLVPLALICLGSPASAGIFFNRQPKPNPTERVPQLLNTVRTDLDESKRSAAVEELRQYEPKDFAEMLPVLIRALLLDPKPGVRAEAAATLGKLRPISQEVGRALEWSLANDASMRVRLQARYALMQYHWNGYQSAKKLEPPAMQSQEPPLAPAAEPAAPAPKAIPPIINTRPAEAPTPAVRVLPVPAPSIEPVPAPQLERLPSGPRQLPAGGEKEEGPSLLPPEG